jgi:DNA repair protein RadC
MRISDWPMASRPRERLLNSGPRSLSDADLLAVFLRTGTAGKSAVDMGRELIGRFGSLRNLFSAPLQDLSNVSGMGPAKYAILQAALELGRRMHHEDLSQGDVLQSPDCVRDFLRTSLRQVEHETFAVLFLDVRNRLLGYEEMFRGTLTQASVYPREVVKAALARNAAGVILAHNHPSGDASPSAADRVLTTTLQKALQLVDVKVHDHFIVAGSGAYSFSEHGDL